MFGAYSFDWGLTLSEGFLVSAGVPISAQGPEIVNGYGDGTIFLQQRGSAGTHADRTGTSTSTPTTGCRSASLGRGRSSA